MLKAPIFIGGTGRSGTTVLQRLINTHDHIFSLTSETQFIVAGDGLIDLLRKNYATQPFRLFLQKLRGRWFRRVVAQRRPHEHIAGLFVDISEQEFASAVDLFEACVKTSVFPDDSYSIAAAFIQSLFSSAALRANTQRWCEKTPRNILYADHLWRMFPDMRFIHILRDGRDVVSSMLRLGFWPVGASGDFPSTLYFQGQVTFEKAVDYWVELLRLARLIAARIPTENYLEVKLEDLVENSSTLERLCNFLGEPWEPRLHDYDLSKSNKGRWKTELTAEQVHFFHERAGEVLLREGYPV
jgi:hypothetical protein